MDNNLPTDDNQKPVTPVETPPTVIPETPTEKPQESPIEIGSLGQPSLSTIQETSGAPKSKSKKVKTIVSILGLLLIIISLPLAVVLVKQRQEIRKEAETPGLSGSVSFCGITISPTGQNFNNGVYTLNYSITGSGHTVEIHTYGCACSEGNRGSCGTQSGQCEGNSFTTNTPYNGSVTAPQIGNCGTYQADVFVVSVDGRSECHNN